ncbi:hypothetical protein WME95_11965 [Sorangium sp. So ce327]|jgi:predicted NACHT family NTPase|uniref:hypothetical protein n=1 Tax=Sorangium sp. So ce327 TaxID=3133301 RepID=UPI003F634B30
MDDDNLRRWLWTDATASASDDPAGVLLSVERDHVDSVWREHSQTNVRVLIRNEQRPVDMDVLPRRVDAPSRCTVPERLARHERVLVVGGRGSGKTALIARLAAQAAADQLVELPVEPLAALLRQQLDGARWVEGPRLVLRRADEE